MRWRLECTFILVCWLIAGNRIDAEDDLVRRQWDVDGVMRYALVHQPATSTAGGAAVVFAFHGHGGTMLHASRSFPIHRFWPEAIVIYPQGLPTPGRLTDPKGEKSGWQTGGEALKNRDLKFFDTMLAGLRELHAVDETRIYATGHSNGGGFTYLLWAERGDVFAAFAPSAAVLARGSSKFRPKPVLHIGSPEDPLVKFSWQARMIDHVLEVNGCGRRDAKASGYTVYPSSEGAEVATYLHDGGHHFPDSATELIVRFFKTHSGS